MESCLKEIVHFAASLLVSPLVSIIDKCLVQEIAGIKPLMISIKAGGLEMMKNPRQFVGALSYRLTVVVYFEPTRWRTELALDEHRVAKEEKRKANQSVVKQQRPTLVS
jgi:hypothetical protein